LSWTATGVPPKWGFYLAKYAFVSSAYSGGGNVVDFQQTVADGEKF